jgi:hypothetical protein
MSGKSKNRPKQVVKSGPTLDVKPSGGLKFTPSEKTNEILSEISEHMASPQADEIGESEDESLVLDPAFANMAGPPAIEIANVALRKRLERDMSPVDVDSLFLRGEIRQEVDILKGKLTIVFRTLSGKEDLYIKKKLSDVKAETMRYVEDRYMMMQLAAHIVSINDAALPNMFKEGTIDEDLFTQRFDKVCALPVMLIERIWVHWVWFQDRVTKEINNDFLNGG